MKLTDYISNYLSLLNIKYAFVLQGGAALHLIDSMEKHPDITPIAMQHEQACAMAADGFAKANNMLGVTVATSGPGATNLLTGIACSYFDSVPTLHLTGNVASFRQSDSLNVRQYGFQETDIVSMAKPITKYAVRLKKPEDILHELPKALSIAMEPRKGPVLIDIPDNFQRECVGQVIFAPRKKEIVEQNRELILTTDFIQFEKFKNALEKAKRPLLILGAGLLSRNVQAQANILSQALSIPYLTTWPLKGMANHDNEYNLGSFGTHSYRGNNIVLQNSDFILSIGSRLDSRATAKLDTFAREAEIAMVDIDISELEKFSKLNKEIKYKFPIDCKVFIETLLKEFVHKPVQKDYKQWHSYIASTRARFNIIPDYKLPLINPYGAAQTISEFLKKDAVVVVDTGTSLPITLVYGKEKKGQRYLSSYNNTPMGYALPCAIGTALASQNQVTCISGDGGLQMNIQELATLRRLNLPILIFVYNNAGYCMIKQTQDDWLESNYFAASLEYGLPKLNFKKIASAYGIDAHRATTNEALDDILSSINPAVPTLIELMISPEYRYEPIIKYGNPLENMNPLLNPETIEKNMLINILRSRAI